MKSGEKIITLVIFLIFIVPLASAATTQINLKTQPNHMAYINIIEPIEDFQQIKMYKEFTGNDGKVSITFSDDDHLRFGLLVVLKKDNLRVDKKRFDDYNAGGVINIELLPDGWVDPTPDIPEPIINETNETEESIEASEPLQTAPPESIEESETVPITGEAITETAKSATSKAIYYVIGVIVIAGLMIIIISGKIIRRKEDGFSKIDVSKNSDDVEKELIKAERKIEEAQKEIRKIKNKEKIEAAQKKIQKDMEELKKLKEGENIENKPNVENKPKVNKEIEENKPEENREYKEPEENKSI